MHASPATRSKISIMNAGMTAAALSMAVVEAGIN
jgi:hypothetical protein